MNASTSTIVAIIAVLSSVHAAPYPGNEVSDVQSVPPPNCWIACWNERPTCPKIKPIPYQDGRNLICDLLSVDIQSDLQLRSRICERYIRFGGQRYKDLLFGMLPCSRSSVYTHGDIAPRNIMVDEKYQISGVLDWEFSGWYPEYWEYAQIMRPACETGDWQSWMDATAPQRWDISGINAARRMLF
ncbi:hypothetical protein LOZ02_002163 [Ophidiomyces ophidiicola]|nr:hypothetical protein LOZ47_002324 [Ophidiomyces ophidiicola]KAI2160465.1 hypothetical protein LOZ26_002656 [Ophidiomyces ophidiicola]KAI2183360.1 hypothetical protein LOZ22_002917 [Ophidiomyces ophidiicola]KAI2259816.1 hypothetical protein LOZ09_002040 [Ophidiomyces ophidiicola]KAI2284133.1 hypothetical protein LOZ02_002163 [Ophidiomyces ophidiicola]